MLNKLIHFSVYHRWTVLFITALLMVAGFFAFQALPIDAVPDITNNQVQVNTQVEGLVPEEIERSITFPLETSMRGIAGVEQIRSISRFGLSQVTIVFKEDIDIYRARQLVAERLQNVRSQLPENIDPMLGPISTGLGEIFQYVVDFKKPATNENERFQQLVELRTLQDWFIKPKLLTVEGVAEVNTTGGYEKQYHVQPDLKKLSSFGVHLDELVDALKSVNRNVGGGYVEQTAEQFLIQGRGLFQSIDDIKKIPVKTLESLQVVRIGDVAHIDLGRELRTGAATHNGQEVVLGTAMMLLGENSRAVSLRVKDKVEEVKKILPPQFELKTVYNRSDLVNATLGTVEHNLMLGATLVIVVLFFLLGNIRAAIITAFTIPLTLLTTFLIMKPLGLSGNLMSLGALDFGIIVDGTVIVLDNCVRYLKDSAQSLGRKLTFDEIKETIYQATVDVRTAAGFGELIVVVVFLPIFGLTGIEGKMFKPMAATFAIAVFCALIFSFTTAPAFASLILSGKEGKEPFLMRVIKPFYEWTLQSSFKARKITLILGLLFVLSGGLLFMTRGAEFLPQLNEGSFAFHMIRPQNASLTQSLLFQRKADLIVKTFPEVDDVFSRMGTSEVATDPMGVNVSDTYIMLKPRDQWPERNGERASYSELTDSMVKKLNSELPGQSYLASQPIQMRFNELLEGTRADVTVKIFGPDLDRLMEISSEIKEVIEKVPGAGDVEMDQVGKAPLLSIVPNQERINSMGASTKEVLDSISIAQAGQEVGSFYEKTQRFPILVRLLEHDRRDLESIKNIPVGLTNYSVVPLYKLADISFEDTFMSVNREEAQRRSAVLINLRGRDTEGFVTEAMQKVEAQVKLPEGYYVEWGGNFKNLQSARSRLMLLTPLALVLVLAMIYVAFGNWFQTLLIFLCVPFALVGGVIGLILNDLPFSISAGVGFIALSGIAVLNGVVLVNYLNFLKVSGKTGFELIREGTLIRLRPVIMTALVAIFGFIPMMLSQGVGAEVQRPLASVVVGGLFTSTALTLILLPILYYMFENKFNLDPAKIKSGH